MSNIVGYTTVNQKNASLRLNDLELAKRDLLNHFHIRKGEKWTQPDFGSNLPYYVFQPLGDSTVQLIKDEVYEIVTYDPRFDPLPSSDESSYTSAKTSEESGSKSRSRKSKAKKKGWFS